jgi:CBS-domain-containing membrane protein
MVLRWIYNQRARGRAFQPRFARREMLGSWLGGLLAITALGVISAWSHYGLVVAPFGASTVLLFGHRRSPLAQPRNIVLGNTLAALVSVVCVALLGVLLRARAGFVVMPVLIGSLLLTGMATLFSRLKGDPEPYPHHWL